MRLDETQDKMDLTKQYDETDKYLNLIEWKDFGTGDSEGDKDFASKLRFQIRLDDFR